MGYPMDEAPFAEKVRHELEQARQRHRRNITSPHEGYAVILEELNELWDVVRAKHNADTDRRCVEELVQVAAMCQRMAEDLSLPVSAVLHRSRFASEEAYIAAMAAAAAVKGVGNED